MRLPKPLPLPIVWLLTTPGSASTSPDPFGVSALQTIAAAWMVVVITEAHQELLVQLRLEHMASQRVGHRPNRIEPRAIKRRPKPHDLLTEPRDQARAKLLAAVAT